MFGYCEISRKTYEQLELKRTNRESHERVSNLTIEDPKRLVLSDLPFSEGQEVEVVVVAKDERDARVRQLKDLLKVTQSVPQVQALSEDDITREVEALPERPMKTITRRLQMLIP